MLDVLKLRLLGGPCPALPVPPRAFGGGIPAGVVPPECLPMLLQCIQGEVVRNMQEPGRTYVWGLVSPQTWRCWEVSLGHGFPHAVSSSFASPWHRALFSHKERSGLLWVHWKPVSRRHFPVLLCSSIEETCNLKQTGRINPTPRWSCRLATLVLNRHTPPVLFLCAEAGEKPSIQLYSRPSGSKITTVFERRDGMGAKQP